MPTQFVFCNVYGLRLPWLK